MTTWEDVQPAVYWVCSAFEVPVKLLPSAPGEVTLDIVHVGGPAMRMTFWACMSHEVERQRPGRYVVQPIGITTDEAHLLIVPRGDDHDCPIQHLAWIPD